MISRSKANEILNDLFLTKAYANSSSKAYLGLCIEAPDVSTGALTNAGEPTVTSYQRKEVSKYEKQQNTSTYNYTGLFEMAKDGTIKNAEDIQMKTAKEAWTSDETGKLKYWFLSYSSSNGAAHIWGEIKSPLQEEIVIESFSLEGTAEVAPEYLLDFNAQDDYVIRWQEGEEDPKEFTVKALKEGNAYKLGNFTDVSPEGERTPFAIFYEETIVDGEAVGKITIHSNSTEITKLTIFEKGIYVPRNTVPTFYAGQLQASLDVSLSV